MKFVRILFFAFVANLTFAQNVAWDTSGNALLNGTYNFREVLWITDLQGSNALDEAASQYGTITFDGKGGYSVSASAWSSAGTAVDTYTRVGTYAISASGFGFIRRTPQDGDIVYGNVVNGVFIGSSTESGFNNLYIAAKPPTTPISTGSFSQNYTIAYMNLPTANMTQIRDATFRIGPNGLGDAPVTGLTGYIGGSTAAVSQTLQGVTYSFTGGVGTINYGGTAGAQTLLTGSQTIYASADGQFLFGGSPRGFDMFVGIRTPASVPASVFSGLYYQAGMDVKRTALPNGTAVLDSYFGALNIISASKNIIGHQRVQVAPDAAYEYTFSDAFTLDAGGAHDDLLGIRNFLSADGSYRIGFGRSSYLGLNVAIKAPAFTGAAPFINPTGVVNAASFTPFTVGLSPGELITLFGTGMAGSTAVDATFPTTLAGVQVKINGILAPLYVVSATQISLIVPYETPPGVAEIQLIRNGTNSNRVTMYVNGTSPGVFAVPATGLGYAAALHPDFSLVTAANPAKIGETIAVYLTGLGAVDPAIATGKPGPVSPFSEVVAALDVTLAGKATKIPFAGLAPLLRGLYQLNFEVPTGVGGGDQYLEIGTPDALNSQILLPVGGPRSATAEAAAPVRTRPAYNSGSARTRSRFDPAATGTSSSPSRER
ncbi:MAG: hypothetical protein ABI811_02255 [Acidobacteriota bacterium]